MHRTVLEIDLVYGIDGFPTETAILALLLLNATSYRYLNVYQRISVVLMPHDLIMLTRRKTQHYLTLVLRR